MPGSSAIASAVKRLRKTEAVCFDLDDTLLQTAYLTECAVNSATKVMEDHGRSGAIPKDRIGDVFWRDGETQFKELLKVPTGEIPAEMVLSAEETAYANLRLYPGTIRLLRLLIRAGMSSAIVTNGKSRWQWRKILKSGLRYFINEVIVSEDIGGIEKPKPEIFEYTLSILDVPADRTLFVGDDLGSDILGAKGVDMMTVRVLQGKHAAERPSNPEETPLLEISSIGDLGFYLWRYSRCCNRLK